MAVKRRITYYTLNKQTYRNTIEYYTELIQNKFQLKKVWDFGCNHSGLNAHWKAERVKTHEFFLYKHINKYSWSLGKTEVVPNLGTFYFIKNSIFNQSVGLAKL